MKKVSALAFSEAAEVAVTRKPPILYSQEDCQAFVEQSIKRAGGDMGDYRGSNDMFRNACDKVMTLFDAQMAEVIGPGCVLFIVEQDGGEPDRYKADGKGNASHIGIYTGGQYEVVHSSASRGRVAESTLRNGWTHVGWLTAVDYYFDLPEGEEKSFDVDTAIVAAKSGSTVRMRVKPSRDAIANANVPVGEEVKVLTRNQGWWQISWNGKTGWMMKEFVDGTYSESPDVDIWEGMEDDRPEIADEPPQAEIDRNALSPAPDVDKMALLTELEGLNKRQSVIIAALKGVV